MGDTRDEGEGNEKPMGSQAPKEEQIKKKLLNNDCRLHGASILYFFYMDLL